MIVEMECPYQAELFCPIVQVCQHTETAGGPKLQKPFCPRTLRAVSWFVKSCDTYRYFSPELKL